MENTMDNTSHPLKVCQMCKKHLTLDHFYRRKNRKGEYSWKTSYCKSCDIQKKNKYQAQNKDVYNPGKNKYKRNYYRKNPEKVKIIQKRYYYNKLPPDKKEQYKQKIIDKHPDWVQQICY